RSSSTAPPIASGLAAAMSASSAPAKNHIPVNSAASTAANTAVGLANPPHNGSSTWRRASARPPRRSSCVDQHSNQRGRLAQKLEPDFEMKIIFHSNKGVLTNEG